MGNNQEVSHVGAWIGAAVAVLYALSPVDILPDVVPFAGWADDLLITVTGGLNLLQSYAKEGNETLAGILGAIKWVVIILGVIAIAIIALLIFVVYKIVA
ncbi:MAG: DUF1232 domain-containing protein [Paludibacteraceae bacterium]|nr:DUF1232 domain-containing protein [Paludibacteraceae bacterium]MBQ6963723.1 DUF1232 domain-containing protein [Paludibacteraceae bacterium]